MSKVIEVSEVINKYKTYINNQILAESIKVTSKDINIQIKNSNLHICTNSKEFNELSTEIRSIALDNLEDEQI